MKLLNAFTPAMVGIEGAFTVEFLPITGEKAAQLAAQGIDSCVGHQGAADLYAAKLGVPVPMNRVNTRLVPGEVALLGQYVGPRLPEGRVLTADELAAAGIRWMLVEVGTGTVSAAMDAAACHEGSPIGGWASNAEKLL